MAKATTMSFEELVLEVEFTTGTWSRVCGLVDATVTRTANVETSEVPDCSDESLPMTIERTVRSLDMTISSSGVWSLAAHEKMLDWWYSGLPLSCRVKNEKASVSGATGDTLSETGPALLTQLNNARAKGQKVTAEVEIQFNGLPTRAAKV